MSHNVEIELTKTTIDTTRALEAVATERAGAVLLFLGTTRKVTAGRETASLDYTAYEPMARAQMEKLAAEAMARWPIEHVAITHRIGHLEVGEVSVAIALSAPHRAEGFSAGQWLIDTLKERVPIWKRENWADGQSEWVHPGLTDLPRTDQQRVE
ncbi:MAG: molybdopterin converting factor [Planctomycetaceae bacterium]|nr:molybdopterin converting factor [Planctomycetaceae bacterium]|tara:strand:+ start:6287 stop:6751 length:465 start_codon:yes stop_codon:yes gene_type:complete